MTSPLPPPPLPGAWTTDFRNGFGDWSLGPVWLDPGADRLALRIEQRHCNAFDVMHGGAMATFVDGQCLAVLRYSGGRTDHTPTVSLTVDYLAPAPLGAWLVAEVRLLRQSRSLIFTQALVTTGEALDARSSAIYRNVQNPTLTRKDAR